MDWTVFPAFACGLVLLILGAELMVRGASRLAQSLGISPLIVGMTVVAYGTSAPELAVTIEAIFSDPPKPDLAVGNVVGSNISNILLVLGLAALVAPLIVTRQLIWTSLPLMIATAGAVYVLGRDGSFSRLDGFGLVAGAITYTCTVLYISRKRGLENYSERGIEPPKLSPLVVIGQLILLVSGLVMLVAGANLLVHASVETARYLGVSELVVGLTIVAVGTSLPEIATSVVAGLRGHRDIAVGNVVGSNIFNVLLVLGLTAVVAPDGVAVSTAALEFDIPLMVSVSIACLPVFLTGLVISRQEGGALLLMYAGYATFLYLSNSIEKMPNLSVIIGISIAPLASVALIVYLIRMYHDKSR